MTPPPLAVADETGPLVRKFGYFVGPLLFLLTLVVTPPEGMQPQAWKTCGIAMWMAAWWISEAMPLPVASLLPVILFPLFSILPLKDTLTPFASPIIFLFLGGFVISLAMEKWNLHLRIGLGILRTVGIGGKSILGGIMLATAFMGMWISNTATTIMMLPMAVSMALLLTEGDEGTGHSKSCGHNPFAKALILGVAYSAIIGGLSTFVGTPTNAILQGHMVKTYHHGFSLADWMRFGVPLMLVLLALTWALLVFCFVRKGNICGDVRGVVRQSFAKLGPMSRQEKIVCGVFLLVATLWIFHEPLEKASGLKLDDAMVSILGAMLLFVIPTDRSFEKFTLTWKDTVKLPWGILIFFGGALSVSDALTATGVTGWLSVKLDALSGVPLALVVAIIVLLLILVTEMMSNIAAVTAFLPILSAMASAMQINPLMILVPATLAASCGFMMPGASAPNALAYGTGYLKVRDMIRTGFVLDIICGAVIVIFTFTVIALALGIDPHTVPSWAAGKQ